MAQLLFPHRFKIIGWILFIPSLIIGLVHLITDFEFDFLDARIFALISDKDYMGQGVFFKIITDNLTNEVIASLIIVGGLLVAFSKLKREDEFISKIRQESLIWATYINYAILLASLILIYGMPFFTVVVVNMFTLLLFFILRFHYLIYLSEKKLAYEE